MPILLPRSRGLRAGLALAGLLALAGCSTEKWGFPYRASVQQGNWITQEQVATLEKGMTRDQVRFVLGSPTLTSVLHSDRWDYPYYYKPGTGTPQQRRFTVWFENDQLARWQGDEQPDIQPFQQAERDVQRSRQEDAEDAREQQDERDEQNRQAESGARIEAVRDTAAGNPGAEPGVPEEAPEPLR